MLHTLTVLVRVIRNEMGPNYINNISMLINQFKNSLTNNIGCYIVNGNQMESK